MFHFLNLFLARLYFMQKGRANGFIEYLKKKKGQIYIYFFKLFGSNFYLLKLKPRLLWLNHQFFMVFTRSVEACV